MVAKPILFLALGSAVFYLTAETLSKTYISPYSDKSVGKGFNISHKYGYSDISQNYYIQFSNMQREGDIYSNAMHPYKQNLRVFLPAFASSFSFYIKRFYWDGYFSIVSKFGSIPNEDISSNDDPYIYMSKLANQSVLIYSDKSKLISDPNYFNYLLEGRTTYHFKVDYATPLTGKVSQEDPKTKLNKWLYILTDTTQIYGYRNLLPGNDSGGVLGKDELGYYNNQSSSSQSYSSLSSKTEENKAVVGDGWLMLNFSTEFYKNLIDEYVAKYLSPIEQNPNYKFCSDPSRYVLGERDLNKSINICIYITSFGKDGDDNNFTTHYLTASNFKEINNIPQTTIKMNLPEIKKRMESTW